MKSGDIRIRPWQRADFAALSAAAPGLSERTLWLRFWASVPTLPVAYLRSTEQRWPGMWDAVAAYDGERLVGWAEYGRYADDPRHADVAVCVVDAEQGQGVGSALLAALIEHARLAGLHSVHADIAPYNERARRGWRRVTGGDARTLALAS